jgi:hypothetical protein
MDVFLADRSVDGPAEGDPRFRFLKKYIGATTDGDFIALDEWVRQSSPGDADLLLQMDIEGFEHESLLSCPQPTWGRFRVIVAELHDLDQFWNRPFFNIASRTIEKLLQTHACVHIHPNNEGPMCSRGGLEIPSLAEFTFLRRDRLKGSRPWAGFPHPLDSDNVPGRPPMVLPECWRMGAR